MADLLTAELRRDPGRPFLTWYDERTGERVELSVTTYANWVAKTASLLTEEHDLEKGDLLMVDLPAHWLGPVFLGAAWLAGLVVTFPQPGDEGGKEPDAVVCGPDGLAAWADRAGDVPVLACSLLPMGVRFADALPPDVHDVGLEVWSQPDSFIPYDPPGPDDVALLLATGQMTQDELWSSVAAGRAPTGGDRLLTGANPASPPGVAALAEPLVRSGSLVLVAGARPDRLDAIAESERVTRRLLA